MIWNSKWFPGTNLQDINLDWILKKVSALRGGRTGQYLYKKSDKDFDFGWKTGGGGGGGTSDYLDLDNKPSINNVELTGNKTASDLGLATPSDIPVVPVQSVNGKTGAVVLDATDVGAYVKPVPGIPKTDLASDVQTSLNKANTALQAVPTSYRTASAQDVIDAAQDADIGTRVKANEIAVVITGARPSIAVNSGQYVIVRNSTISGITDGLYIANTSLSPSTDVIASNLTAVTIGGLNDIFVTTSDRYWQSINLPSYGVYGNITKCGKICAISLIITANVSAADSGTWTELLQINDGYRPITAVGPTGSIIDNNVEVVKTYDISSNGILRFGSTPGHTYRGISVYAVYLTT